MLYFATISYFDPYRNVDSGDRQESTVFANFAVEASDPNIALKKLRQRIIELHDEDERYYNVHEFFLDSFVEIDLLGTEAKEISWTSIVSFGDSFAQLQCKIDDDPALRNYVLRRSPNLVPNYPCPYSAVNTQLIPLEEDEGEDEEAVPLLSYDRDRYQIKPLYKELCRRKFQNTLQDFKELSDGDLYELYVVEGCTSNEIANLFEIKKSKVDYRRRKIDATFDEEVVYGMLRDLDLIDPIPYKSPEDLDKN